VNASEPSVTAVIPAYNSERFLADAIDSVLAQTYPIDQIIVVDDGSSDGTAEVAARFPEVEYLRKENGGASSARNFAMPLVTGRLIAFLDADDVWVPTKTELQVREFSKSPKLGLVYSGLFVTDGDLRVRYRLDPAPANVALRKTLLLEKPYMTGVGSSGMVPRWLIDELQPMFDERFGVSQDWAFSCRVAAMHPVAAVDQPLFLYRQHSSGQVHRDHDQIEKDVELFLAEIDHSVLSNAGVSPNRVRANLHLSLAFGHLRNRRWLLGSKHLIKSFSMRPDRLPVALLARLKEIRQGRI
jgi:glycosyltransferase involved in cell wall biosynthesis